jgi:hypothetical protein
MNIRNEMSPLHAQLRQASRLKNFMLSFQSRTARYEDALAELVCSYRLASGRAFRGGD